MTCSEVSNVNIIKNSMKKITGRFSRKNSRCIINLPLNFVLYYGGKNFLKICVKTYIDKYIFINYKNRYLTYQEFTHFIMLKIRN